MIYEQFLEDERTNDAVIRNLEIIGEATRNIPEMIRDRYPKINWHQIAGLRNIVAHEYFSLEDEIIWDIIQFETPELLHQVEKILEDFQENGE